MRRDLRLFSCGQTFGYVRGTLLPRVAKTVRRSSDGDSGMRVGTKKCSRSREIPLGTATPKFHEFDDVPVTQHDRRKFLSFMSATGLAALAPTQSHAADAAEKQQSLDGVVGITTGGGLGRKRERGELNLLKLPAYVRDELGLKLIDVNTRWFESYEDAYLKRVRRAADAAGCFFSNLKVNQPVSGLYSRDANERDKALSECRRLIDTAKTLGARWIRFIVTKAVAAKPVAHRDLTAYAEQLGVQLLVENGGWMKKDPNSIVSIVKAIGRNVAPCPDTGNWDDDVRQQGLRNSFPGAASCDFKVWELDDDHRHARYDLKQCFDIGWKAKFRGPWIIENMPDDTNFTRNTIYVRDLLKKWISKNRYPSL